MSLSASLANALTGLTASARAASVVSSNVANAMTEGYARRELNLSPQSVGGAGAGVKVDGVTRVVDRALLTDRRLADAEAANTRLKSGFLGRIERLAGTPEDAGSLSSRLADLEAAFVQAASRPDSQARLQDVADAAAAVARHLNLLSDTIQRERMDADAGIAQQVRMLNDTLGSIDRLNAEILSATASGHDATALMDQRQILVDRVAEIVPVREVLRDRNQISLYTTGGAINGRPVRFMVDTGATLVALGQAEAERL
ncbi:MAG: FlgK family flagellar hook-associated protein, partial [Albidovulum sp.]